MPDLLIRGMEMPESCDKCSLFNECWCMALGIENWRKSYNKPEQGERLPDCPLVPLPEGHGRLGDLDKINASLGAMIEIECNQNAAPHSWSHAYTEMQSILDDAPTIVPAEGGTDDA